MLNEESLNRLNEEIKETGIDLIHINTKNEVLSEEDLNTILECAKKHQDRKEFVK